MGVFNAGCLDFKAVQGRRKRDVFSGLIRDLSLGCHGVAPVQKFPRLGKEGKIQTVEQILGGWGKLWFAICFCGLCE